MRLFLVDTSIFVFRAWYGPDPGRLSLEQQPDQAFVGFSDFVYRLLTEQAPSRIVFAFDESLGSSARRDIYPEYKANRAPAPQELKNQFAWCRQWLEALGISCVSSKRWEADDLIGSLAHYHRREEMPLAILTADKDLTQLIEEGDWWWSYLDDRKLDYRAICKKFGVRPDQIAEQLALTGDKVDNIPGVPEIGPKTAARLLRRFDSIDNLRRHVDEVGKMKFRYAALVQQSLIDHADQLETSLQLTRINCRIEAMRDLSTRIGAADAAQLECMMHEHAFEPARLARWSAFLENLEAGAA